MSDDEWTRLRGTFQKEQLAMPSVLTRARNDRKRVFVGRLLVYLMLLPVALLQVPPLRRAVTLADFGAPLFIISMVAIILICVHVALRGTLAEGRLTPLELLNELEKRHAGRRKLLRFLPWIGAYVLSGMIVAAVHGWVAAGRVDVPTIILLVVILAYAIGTHIFLDRWARGRITRDVKAVAEARRLLADDGVEGPR